ncbi:MAG: hypothetical protein LQ346_006607, partial [Caloplaca aetnensis]
MAFPVTSQASLAFIFCLLLIHNAWAQDISATNDQSNTEPEFDLRTTSPVSYIVDPLTDRSAVTKVTLEGAITFTTPSTVNDLTDSDIAYISCDDSAYQGNIGANDIFKTVVNLQRLPVAVILYSLNSTRCTFSPNNWPAPSIYTMKDNHTSSEILAMLQSNTTMPSNATLSPREADGNGGILGKSPTTAVAMIILYSITGLITALFLIIIVVGAIRAHRHPERYGPRNIIGRPRQSRAKGIARAMLETIPIVKFGDHEDAKPADQTRDIEMPPQPAVDGAASQDQAHIEATGAGAAEQRRATEGGNDAVTTEVSGSESHAHNTDDSMANADNGLACSVCTDDFAKGQDVRVLPCNHKFHPECIDPWLLNVSGTCPLCRVDLRPTASNPDGSEDPNIEPSSRRHSEALTSFNPAVQPQSRRGSRAHPLHYLHHYLNRGRMEEATPQERLEALRRLRLVNRSDVNHAAQPERGEGAATGERTRNRLSARFSRAFGADRSRPSSWAPTAPTPPLPEARNPPENHGAGITDEPEHGGERVV